MSDKGMVHSDAKSAVVPTEAPQTAVLADIIRKNLLGVRPDEQAVVLEDDDWRLILASLDHPSGAPDRPRR